MDIEALQQYCTSFKGCTTDIKWDECLCFSVGEKIFCISLLNERFKIGIKINPEFFDEYVAQKNVKQAPHFAKRQWISIDENHLFSNQELKILIEESYNLVFKKLTKKTQAFIQNL